LENTVQQKIRVGIIRGGMSSERDVSLENGKKVALPVGFSAALRRVDTALVKEFINGVDIDIACGAVDHHSAVPLIPLETVPASDVLSLEDRGLL
jgi:hypothetical protein